MPYLAHLRREEIPYRVAGTRRVDLSSALATMHRLLGVECVVSEGGGGINGALFDQGLVDELHVVTVPALVGGASTPSLYDGPARARGSVPVCLRTVHIEVGALGSTWAHYEVVAAEAHGTDDPGRSHGARPPRQPTVQDGSARLPRRVVRRPVVRG